MLNLKSKASTLVYDQLNIAFLVSKQESLPSRANIINNHNHYII